MELDDYAKLSSVVAALIAKTCVAVLTVQPSHGPKEGGTVVVVGGYGFSQSSNADHKSSSSSAAAACRFGSTASELVTFVNSTAVVCRTTAGDAGATVPVSYAADGVQFCASAAEYVYDGGGGGCPTPDCDGHGQCVNDQCFCDKGWSGPNCDEQSCPHDCCGHGTCDGASGTCTCNDGYAGPDCCNEVGGCGSFFGAMSLPQCPYPHAYVHTRACVKEGRKEGWMEGARSIHPWAHS